MINSQMDNPFMIGDLVHIPKGVVYYALSSSRRDEVTPLKVNDKPSVGLILKKEYTSLYKIAVGEKEYLIKKEDISLIIRKDVR